MEINSRKVNGFILPSFLVLSNRKKHNVYFLQEWALRHFNPVFDAETENGFWTEWEMMPSPPQTYNSLWLNSGQAIQISKKYLQLDPSGILYGVRKYEFKPRWNTAVLGWIFLNPFLWHDVFPWSIIVLFFMGYSTDHQFRQVKSVEIQWCVIYVEQKATIISTA